MNILTKSLLEISFLVSKKITSITDLYVLFSSRKHYRRKVTNEDLSIDSTDFFGQALVNERGVATTKATSVYLSRTVAPDKAQRSAPDKTACP